MWRPTAALLLVAFVAACAGAEEDVLNLGDDDFESTLKQHDTTLVMFYAPWCGYCKRLKPEYAEAAEIVKNDDPPIKLAKVDCTEDGKEICNKYSVSGYPTLKIFRQDEMLEDYKGPRKAASIVKYMRDQARSLVYKKMHSVARLVKMAELAQMLDNKDYALFDYINKNIDSKLAKIVLKKRHNCGLEPMS